MPATPHTQILPWFATLLLIAGCSGGGGDASASQSDSDLPDALREASDDHELAIVSDNIELSADAFLADDAVVLLLNRTPIADDPELTLSMTDSAGATVPGTAQRKGRHLYFVPEQPLQDGRNYTISLPSLDQQWHLTAASPAASGHWLPVTAGMQRPVAVRQLVHWQGDLYALGKGARGKDLYRWDPGLDTWALAHASAADQLMYDEGHLLLFSRTAATPVLPDGSLGDGIAMGWQARYGGFRGCLGAGALYVYHDEDGDILRIDLDSRERQRLTAPPHGKPEQLAVDAAGDLLIAYQHATKDWWQEQGYSAKDKVDGGNWDPDQQRWRYERAVYRLRDGVWSDVTANLLCGNMTDAISPGPVGWLRADADADPLLLSTEQGLWQWQPQSSDWVEVVDTYGNSRFSVHDDKVIVRSRHATEAWQAGFTQAYQLPKPHGVNAEPVWLPDDSIFIGIERELSLLGENNESVPVAQGPYRYRLGPDTPTRSYNLEVDFAGIIGESAGNTVIDAEVVAGGQVAVVGSFAGTHEVRFHDGLGQQQGSSLALPAEPTDADEDAGALAVATPTGPVIIAADRSVRAIATAVVADAEHCRVDFHNGFVAWLADKTVRLYDQDLELLDQISLGHSYVTDVAIDAERKQMLVVGFDNKRNDLPVQVPVARAFSWASGALEEQWHLWRYDPKMLDHDMADSRLYHVLYAENGSAYVAGETAGGNTVFRWNGRNLTSSVLIKTDPYTDPWQTRSEHKLYYGKIDPDAGELLYGQMVFPRKSNFEGNTFSSRGDLEVTADGTLYFAGACAARMQGRDLNRINGERVGAYDGGDLTLLMVSPDFRNRLRWTCFNREGSAGGGTALAITDTYAVLGGTIKKGGMIVTDGSTPLSPEQDEVDDAYLVIWDPAQDRYDIPQGISKR
ncbi:MAG: hypothetical protein ACOCXA_00620 [Planctomycetota bacterium]